MKTCPKCGETKPATAEFFYQSKNRKSGFDPYCRLCTRAYTRSRTAKILRQNTASPPAPAATKKCCGCKEVLAGDQFFTNLRRGDGYSSECRRCMADRRLRHRYGISMERKGQMYAEQQGRCACCLVPVEFSKICVDHDHSYPAGDPRSVRELLCHRCNKVIGFASENPEFLRAHIRYLAKHSRHPVKFTAANDERDAA